MTTMKLDKAAGHARKGSYRSVCILATVLFLCGSAYLSTRAFSASPKPAQARSRTAALATAPADPSHGGPVQLIQFYIYDVGIYPRQAHAAKGIAIAIALRDVSGGSAGLVLEAESAGANLPVGQVQRLLGNSVGQGYFHLQPGRYQVYAQETPGARAELIVDP